MVGVIVALALFFATHVFWPNHLTIDWLAMFAAAIAFVALYRFKVSTLHLIALFAVLGLLLQTFK